MRFPQIDAYNFETIQYLAITAGYLQDHLWIYGPPWTWVSRFLDFMVSRLRGVDAAADVKLNITMPLAKSLHFLGVAVLPWKIALVNPTDTYAKRSVGKRKESSNWSARKSSSCTGKNDS